jgi:hypothetical protein
MVIQGLTDYVALSGELANSSDVEVLVNGTSVGKRHFGPGDGFGAPWRIIGSGCATRQRRAGVIRKSGNGLTYWSAESAWYSADKRLFQQGKLALNLTRDYYLLQKRQDKPTDPITYDLAPIKGPVHVGDIVAVRLAVSGTDWKLPAGRGSDSGRHGVSGGNRPLQAEQQAGLVGGLVYAQGVPRRPCGVLQHRLQWTPRVRVSAQGGQRGQVRHQSGAGRPHVSIEC